MLKRKFKQQNEFCISVQYHRRNYSYRVKHELLKGGEEVFNIIANQKIVVLTSKLMQLCDHKNNQPTYVYDELAITNKCLMNRIIEAIDQYKKIGAYGVLLLGLVTN